MNKPVKMEPGVKLRDAEKMALIPVKVLPTEKNEMLRKPEWLKIRLPKSTEELINSLPIKWMARDLGFQKLVMKSGKMVAHFILNQDSDYFKSAIFQHILVQVQSLAPHASLKQKNDKLSLVFQKITSIEKAKQILTKLQPKIQVEA